jgi:hypothetical protein
MYLLVFASYVYPIPTLASFFDEMERSKQFRQKFIIFVKRLYNTDYD